MKRAWRRLAIPLLAMSLAPLPAQAIDAFTRSADLGAGYDANVGNSISPEDERNASIVSAGAGASWERRFGLYSALQLSGGVAAEQVFAIEDLSNARATMRLRLRHKPGRGFYVPVLAAWTSFGARDYGSPIRDSYDYRAGVSLTEPLTTTVQVRAEAIGARRESKGRVYDLDGVSLGLNLDWVVSPRATVYASVTVDETPIVVSARGLGIIAPKTQHLYLNEDAAAIEADDAFGEDWWAFRVEGRTTLLAAAGVNVPLSSMMALDFQVRRGETSVRKYTYERVLGGVSLLMRW